LLDRRNKIFDAGTSPLRDKIANDGIEGLMRLPHLPACLYLTAEEIERIKFDRIIGFGRTCVVVKVEFLDKLYALKIFNSNEYNYLFEARVIATFHRYFAKRVDFVCEKVSNATTPFNISVNSCLGCAVYLKW
jgi:hypothetical protein